MPLAVKICGVTSPEDAQMAVLEGASAVGLVFDHGPRLLDLAGARRVLAALEGAEVERVAVVGSSGVSDALRELGFDLWQGVGAPTADLPWLPAFFDGPEVEAEIAAWPGTLPPRRSMGLTGCLNFDGPGGGGTGARADWSRAAQLARRYPLCLAGGLRADNLEEAIARVRPMALDVTSGVEAAPGRLDRARLRDFLAVAREAEGARA